VVVPLIIILVVILLRQKAVGSTETKNSRSSNSPDPEGSEQSDSSLSNQNKKGTKEISLKQSVKFVVFNLFLLKIKYTFRKPPESNCLSPPELLSKK
jgi:hypothetical protein